MCVATESLLFCCTFQNAFDACNFMPCGWRDLSSHKSTSKKLTLFDSRIDGNLNWIVGVRFCFTFNTKRSPFDDQAWKLFQQRYAMWISQLTFVIDFFRALFLLWFCVVLTLWLPIKSKSQTMIS